VVDIHDFLMEAHQPRIDPQSEHERYRTEKYAKKPVIVMNHPKV
jgi:aspartyl/asparaginyl-tRNA synthetase